MLRTSYKYGHIVYESAMKLEEGKTLFDERLVLAGDIKEILKISSYRVSENDLDEI